jgi:hypothetical protein
MTPSADDAGAHAGKVTKIIQNRKMPKSDLRSLRVPITVSPSSASDQFSFCITSMTTGNQHGAGI